MTNLTRPIRTYLIQGETNGVPGPKLPYRLINACAVKLSETEIFVIGGESGITVTRT